MPVIAITAVGLSSSISAMVSVTVCCVSPGPPKIRLWQNFRWYLWHSDDAARRSSGSNSFFRLAIIVAEPGVGAELDRLAARRAP